VRKLWHARCSSLRSLGEDRGSGRVLIRHKIKRSDLAAMAGSRQVLGGTGHGMIPTESCPSRPGPSELPSLDGADHRAEEHNRIVPVAGA
jgi:hypothetical protein